MSTIKTHAETNAEFLAAAKNLKSDPENFSFCVAMALCQIENLKAQLLEEGYEYMFDTSSCRWAIEQKIINRNAGETMMGVAYKYVEYVENIVLSHNGLL